MLLGHTDGRVPPTDRSSRVPDVRTVAYGDHPDQVLTVHRPDGAPRGPTVVLVHGGFWRERYRADLMEPLAADLAERGSVAVNIEYRRVGGAGGWPVTLADAAAATDHLATLDDVDCDRVVTLGHSAGGHLAVWLAARPRLPMGAVGADPVVVPCGAVSQAGVIDLHHAVELDLGEGTPTVDLLGGGPADVPERYAVASPAALLPLGVPVVLVQGADDDVVPPVVHARYAERARAAGDAVREVLLPGDHFDVIAVDHPLWAAAVEAVRGLC
jgi:acetyl esterase/lipase